MGQHYSGLQPVPLEKIIGSIGRSDDFDRVFLPTQRHSRSKWVSVDSAYLEGVDLPPVQLYKVGDAYFVVDGHHRVSVARRRGQMFIDAEVIEVQSRVPVTTELTIDDLDTLSAYTKFLEETKLDRIVPDQKLRLTMPGDYAKLIEHIRVHKYFMETEAARELSWEEAVKHWYGEVYTPIMREIRRNDMLAEFSDRTEADLYLWLIDHAYYLSQKLGMALAPWEVARDYASRFSRRPRRLYRRIKQKLADLLIPDQLESGPPAGAWRAERVEPRSEPRLFRDILVTVTGAETGWRALAQAAEIAKFENSILRGMHVVSSPNPEAEAYGREVLEQFTRECEERGIRSTTVLVKGNVEEHIIERARWSDMVVINQRRVHGRWEERPLGTIFQTVAAQAARPILAVPGNNVVPLRRVLLAYDGSPKSREALFILRHMVCNWNVEAVIATVESARTDQDMLDAAWSYTQEAGNCSVDTLWLHGQADVALLRTVGELDIDLLLMGSYGYQPLLKAFLGSTVDRVLRVAWFPVLICR